jgi:hypothetical protein
MRGERGSPHQALVHGVPYHHQNARLLPQPNGDPP